MPDCVCGERIRCWNAWKFNLWNASTSYHLHSNSTLTHFSINFFLCLIFVYLCHEMKKKTGIDGSRLCQIKLAVKIIGLTITMRSGQTWKPVHFNLLWDSKAMISILHSDFQWINDQFLNWVKENDQSLRNPSMHY